jgi:hypothetical protein
MDMTGQVSEPLQSEILLADAYEPDGDAAHGATYLGAPQTHTLHTAADEDWMRVYLLPDYVYEVEVYHLSESWTPSWFCTASCLMGELRLSRRTMTKMPTPASLR